MRGGQSSSPFFKTHVTDSAFNEGELNCHCIVDGMYVRGTARCFSIKFKAHRVITIGCNMIDYIFTLKSSDVCE